MSELLFGILGLVVMFVAMILRMPVGMAMLVVGLLVATPALIAKT